MIEPEQLEQAQKMLLMAGKDIKVLHALLDPNSADNEIFGFHAQQAAEKSLKSWIAGIGGSYDKTHDLRVLLLTLRELGCDVTPFRELTDLNVYAIWFRYEPMEETTNMINRQTMLERVLNIFKHVQRVLALLESRQAD
jgi:HEPN domain-containing protein